MVTNTDPEYNYPTEYSFTSEQKHIICEIIDIYRNQMANDDSPTLDALEREFHATKEYDSLVRLSRELDKCYCIMMEWYVWIEGSGKKAETSAIEKILETLNIKYGESPNRKSKVENTPDLPT